MKKGLLILTIMVMVMTPALYGQVYQLSIEDVSSLVRTGMNPHPTDDGDTALAYTLMNALDHRYADSLLYVRDAYRKKADDDRQKEKSWGALAYIVGRMLNADDANIKHDILSDDLYQYFTDNECSHLKNYLVIKYELNNYRPRSVKEHIAQRTFYDDFLMFNDPGREAWDKTSEIMSKLPLKKGDRVVDVGCGFGYNSLRLLDLVGDNGIVYATDTEKDYIDHLSQVMQKNNIDNLMALHTQSDNLGVSDMVDCVFMSSLYHIIYTWSREDERSALLKSIKKQLKNNGYFVIVDNYNLHGGELNNCHVSPQLVEAQLGFWGFEKVALHTLSDKRYMLIMRRNDNYVPNVKAQSSKGVPSISINSQKSIVHIGSLDSYDITDLGIDAANYVYDFASGGDRSLGEIAIKKYDEIIPKENFGGEYTALKWLCKALLAAPTQLESMLKDPLVRSFYHKMTDDTCKVLRYYLLHKYKLGSDSLRMLSDSILEMSGEVGRTHRSYLEDYILALNPMRQSWENTPLIINNLGIKPGDIIADIGSGSGFFSYQFFKITGTKGKVYAVELKDEHLNTLQQFIETEHITNIDTIKGREDLITLPEKVDMAFMCSLYHVMYAVVSDSDRDTYLKSLKECIKPGGSLVVVDNGPVDDSTLPYHGPYISRELIEYQLYYYGFILEDYIQIIPQRYLLKFKLKH